LITLSRSNQFCSSLDPPIQSVKMSRLGVGDWQTGCEFDLSISTSVNFKKGWSYTITPYICIYIYLYICVCVCVCVCLGVMPGKHKEDLFYFLPHAVHICTN